MRDVPVQSLIGASAPVVAEAPILPLAARDLTLEIGGKTLVDAVSLTVAPGGVTCVMGPNGAGKSLLLRLLHGLLMPTAGEVLWAGRHADAAIRRRQAMVFQRPVLLRRSVRANVLYALKARGASRADRAWRAGEALARGRLDHLADAAARRLSGGEQQRLALIRALVTDPDILFLDEPTSSLDPASAQQIEALVRDAAGSGIKIVMITHDRGQAARLADDVVFLNRGRLIEHSAASTFFDSAASEDARRFLAGDLVF